MTGLQLARRMSPQGVTVTIGKLDLYTPAVRNIHLSARTAVQTDWRAHARAAHEAAHAVQHFSGCLSFRLRASWLVRSWWCGLLPSGVTLGAVLARWHPWAVAGWCALFALLRVAVVLWVEAEATNIALVLLRIERMEHPGTESYLRRMARSYLALAIGL